MSERRAVVQRETGETSVSVDLAIDGSGRGDIQTGVGFLNHMLQLFARHGLFDLTVRAKGDLDVDQHHTVEDLGIVLGRAFSEALGERRGIRRMAHAIVPMDESLAMVAVDFGGRGRFVLSMQFNDEKIGDLPSALIPHFLESFAQEARMNLHVRLLEGENDHHKAEAIFKGIARALDQATQIDERLRGRIPSTKETIEH